MNTAIRFVLLVLMAGLVQGVWLGLAGRWVSVLANPKPVPLVYTTTFGYGSEFPVLESPQQGFDVGDTESTVVFESVGDEF